MKRKLLYITTLLLASFSVKAQLFFNQDFNSPVTLSSIIGTGVNQFDGVSNSGTGSVALTDNKLVLTRAAGTGVAYFVKNTSINSATQFIKVQFKLTITNIQSSTSPSATFAFGSGFANDDLTEDNSKVWASIGTQLHNSSTATYRLRDIGSGTNAGVNYDKATETIITFYLNATNEPQNYIGPDGNPYTLSGQRWNAFMGNDRQLFGGEADRSPITSTVAINNFKFRFGVHVGDWKIDDLTMESLTVVLPVSLTSFTGNWENGSAQLKWQTASEQNNSHFDLLRSADGKSFAKIGTKDGNGTTSQISNYVYTDRTALAGINYYKLRQVDFDGKYKDYDAVAVKNPLQAQLLAAIVTASGDLSVKLNSSSEKSATLSIINTQGKKIATHNVSLQEGENHLLLPFSQAAAGVYIVSVDGVQAQKFLKK